LRKLSKAKKKKENVTIVGLQWGDEGKGKIVDYIADDFEAVARFNGGSNAGHTIVIGGERRVFHLLPSGAPKGKELLIGPGVALDPVVLSEEVALLQGRGSKPDLLVDGRCTLVTPFERIMDAAIEEMRGARPLGTTRRGVGPAYAMRALRLAPRAIDLFSNNFDFNSARTFHRSLREPPPSLRGWLLVSRKVLKEKLGDVASRVAELNERGKAVIFEGSQGTLLDVLYGTYPYVTGSPTIANYAAAGLGVSRNADVLGVLKCYTTRVGAGPFPTEITGRLGEKIREVGKEYGATTGRPRRVGWLDLIALRYAARLNGVKELAISKVDVLEHVKELKVCIAYRLDGREIDDFYEALSRIEEVRPVYREVKPLFHAEMTDGRLPSAVESFIELLEDQLKARVRLVSYGEERSRTLER
jgi:adenylosuccinate synthase